MLSMVFDFSLGKAGLQYRTIYKKAPTSINRQGPSCATNGDLQDGSVTRQNSYAYISQRTHFPISAMINHISP